MSSSDSLRVGGAGLLALVATYGIGRQAYGLFVPAFRRDYGLALDVLGYLASAAQMGFLVATVVTGVLAARLGPRVPVVAGCAVLAVGSAVVAVAPGPMVLAVGVIAAGTSAGGTWAPYSDAIDLLVAAPGQRRALALVNAGSPAGLVVASLAVLVAGDRWRIAWWLFAAIGLVAAVVNVRVLSAVASDRPAPRRWPGLRWFFHARSARLFGVAFAAAVTSGAYFSYAPDTAQAAGLPSWVGPAMWAVLGVAGSAVGLFGGGLANRFGLRWPLAATMFLLAGSALLLLAAESLALTLGSAMLFGIGFTTGFAFIVMWSQDLFPDRPGSGFTVTIVCVAVGFSAGPAIFGFLATRLDRPTALWIVALPSIVAALVPPHLGAAEEGRR